MAKIQCGVKPDISKYAEKRVVDVGLWNVALRMLGDVDMVVVLMTTTKVFKGGESWFCSFRLHVWNRSHDTVRVSHADTHTG